MALDPHTTYCVERGSNPHMVVCFLMNSKGPGDPQMLPTVLWWEKTPAEETPLFDTGNVSIGSLTLAASILAHHFGDSVAPLRPDALTLRYLLAFTKEMIATQRLDEPGGYYLMDTTTINEWLASHGAPTHKYGPSEACPACHPKAVSQ